jgi:hypothetical protein
MQMLKALLKMNSRLMLLIKNWHIKISKRKTKNNKKLFNKSNKCNGKILTKKKLFKIKLNKKCKDKKCFDKMQTTFKRIE